MSDERYLHLIRTTCPLPSGTHVVAYCRDSGGEEQDRSVQQQIQVVREFCSAHGLILERTYVDEAKLSSNTEKRTAINELLSDLSRRFKQIRSLEKRKAQVEKYPFGVIVWKSNRLGRDSIETTYIKADLRIRGITIVNLVPSLETGDATIDALFEVVQQYQDEKLLEEISDNSRRGLAELVSLRDTDPEFRLHNPDWPTNDGRYLGIKPGPLPTGLKAERILIGLRDRKRRKQGGEKHYVQRMIPNRDDDVWERCKLAWQMGIDGMGIKKIMDTTRLFSAVSGYDHFFENRIYTGDLDYGKLYERFVPALIPYESWEEEQRRRQERIRKQKKLTMDPLHEPRRVDSRHLLTGLVFCGAVDGEEHPMTADTVPAREGKRTRWDFYICSHKKNSRERQCQAQRVSAAALDESVIDNLMTQVLTRDHLRPIADALAESVSERNQDVMVRVTAVQTQLDEVQKAIRQLVNAVEKMGFSTSLQARLQEREDEECKLIAELVNLQELLVKLKDIPKVTDQQLDDWIASIRQALTGDDIELARQAIRQFVAKIVVNGKAGTLYYTFPLSNLSRLHEVVPTSVGTVPLPSLNAAANRLLDRLYWGIPVPQKPLTEKHVSKETRNDLICERYAEGDTLESIGAAFGISVQRVHQIIYRWRS